MDEETKKFLEDCCDLLTMGRLISGHMVYNGADYNQCPICCKQTMVAGYAWGTSVNDAAHESDCQLKKLADMAQKIYMNINND